jgi:sensor domain CHASE-containing protein
MENIKLWIFVILLFISSFTLVIVGLGLITRSYNKRKEKKELRKRREVIKTRLNELIGDKQKWKKIA